MDINVLVKNCVAALVLATGKNSGLRTALAREELKVILDPIQMEDNLAAFVRTYLAMAKGAVVTIGTRFLPIHAILGNKGRDKGPGCALLYVDVNASDANDRAGIWAEGSNRSSVFRSLIGAVKKINGCARVLAGRDRRERLNIYLPVTNV
jgi:hypothetical protein